MISIIIPAHDEEQVIARSLSGLLRGARPDELEIIVTCNGCHDRTADIARRFGTSVQVLETSTASKVTALNMGDEAASHFPRLYLDADVQMSIDDVRALANAVSRGELAASPVPRMDFSRSSWPVRAFYGIWLNLPYVKEGLIGVGVYALSTAGRSRFGKLPQVINDDGYVRSLFAPHERKVVASAVSIVSAPAALGGLIKIMTRSRLGSYQLRDQFPQQVQAERAKKNYMLAFGRLIAQPTQWPATAVYIFVNVVTRIRARRQYSANRFDCWERDDTSRQNTAAILPTPASTHV